MGGGAWLIPDLLDFTVKPGSVPAGHQQQGAAQHLLHAVPGSDGGGGVHARRRRRHVPGVTARPDAVAAPLPAFLTPSCSVSFLPDRPLHREPHRPGGDRHAPRGSEPGRARRSEHHLPLRLPHRLPEEPARLRTHLRRRLRPLQEHLPRGEPHVLRSAGSKPSREVKRSFC